MTSWKDANWHKATASNGSDDCVEVAELGGRVGVRDSKDRRGPVLEFTREQWTCFTGKIRRAEPR